MLGINPCAGGPGSPRGGPPGRPPPDQRARACRGLLTVRIAWICPSRMSSAKVLRTFPSRSRRIAPGSPFTWCGSTTPPIRTNGRTSAASTRGHVLGAEDDGLPLRGLPVDVSFAEGVGESRGRRRRIARRVPRAPFGRPRTEGARRPYGAAPARVRNPTGALSRCTRQVNGQAVGQQQPDGGGGQQCPGQPRRPAQERSLRDDPVTPTRRATG